jgi:hypothetical protein
MDKEKFDALYGEFLQLRTRVGRCRQLIGQHRVNVYRLCDMDQTEEVAIQIEVEQEEIIRLEKKVIQLEHRRELISLMLKLSNN